MLINFNKKRIVLKTKPKTKQSIPNLQLNRISSARPDYIRSSYSSKRTPEPTKNSHLILHKRTGSDFIIKSVKTRKDHISKFLPLPGATPRSKETKYVKRRTQTLRELLDHDKIRPFCEPKIDFGSPKTVMPQLSFLMRFYEKKASMKLEKINKGSATDHISIKSILSISTLDNYEVNDPDLSRIIKRSE